MKARNGSAPPDKVAGDGYDVAVIGAGPGGYVAALKSAAAGLRTALIEKDRLGGVCLNRGCIPAKTLIAAADDYARLAAAGSERREFDAPAAFQRAGRAVQTLTKGLEHTLRTAGVQVLAGEAGVNAPGKVLVRTNAGATELACRNLVIATGSQPAHPRALSPDGERVLSSDDVFEKKIFPYGRVVIVGGGFTGFEFASMLALAGRSVSIVELLPDVLAGADAEMRKELLRAFRKRRIVVTTGAAVEAIDKSGPVLSLTVSGGRQVEADFVLLAVGRRPVYDGIDVAALGIRMNEQRRLQVDAACRAAEGIYAIGDVAGAQPQLAHAASHQAAVAVEHITTGRAGRLVPPPAIVYTHPELAWAGLTEEAARAEYGDALRVGRCPMHALGRAHTLDGETGHLGAIEGLVKVLAAPDGRAVGVHIVCTEASELIAAGLLAIEANMSLEDLARMPLPHPTFSEALSEAAGAALRPEA